MNKQERLVVFIMLAIGIIIGMVAGDEMGYQRGLLDAQADLCNGNGTAGLVQLYSPGPTAWPVESATPEWVATAVARVYRLTREVDDRIKVWEQIWEMEDRADEMGYQRWYNEHVKETKR